MKFRITVIGVVLVLLVVVGIDKSFIQKVNGQSLSVAPTCGGSAGGGVLVAGGTVTITMRANEVVDGGRLDVFNGENRDITATYNIPRRVRFNGRDASLTNGVLSADGKTVSYVVSYDDLSGADQNYSNTYLREVQLNGVFSVGGLNSAYDSRCVRFVTLDPRPNGNACTVCPGGTYQHADGNADCNGAINGADFYRWRSDYEYFMSGNFNADVWGRSDFVGGAGNSCDKKVDIVDYGQLYWGFVAAHNGVSGMLVPTAVVVTPVPLPSAVPSATATRVPLPTVEATVTLVPSPTITATITHVPLPTAEATATLTPKPTAVPLPTSGQSSTPAP